MTMNEATLIYPGAIGWGVETPGGRGGRIVRITTTEDEKAATGQPAPGTLRYALQLKEPRTVIFDVGGVFDVGTDDVWIGGGCNHLTVFGQTAPYPGVNIRGIIRIRTHNVFCNTCPSGVWPSLQSCCPVLTCLARQMVVSGWSLTTVRCCGDRASACKPGAVSRCLQPAIRE